MTGAPRKTGTRSSGPPGFMVIAPTSCLVHLWCVALSARRHTGGRTPVAAIGLARCCCHLFLTVPARAGRNFVTKILGDRNLNNFNAKVFYLLGMVNVTKVNSICHTHLDQDCEICIRSAVSEKVVSYSANLQAYYLVFSF